MSSGPYAKNGLGPISRHPLNVGSQPSGSALFPHRPITLYPVCPLQPTSASVPETPGQLTEACLCKATTGSHTNPQTPQLRSRVLKETGHLPFLISQDNSGGVGPERPLSLGADLRTKVLSSPAWLARQKGWTISLPAPGYSDRQAQVMGPADSRQGWRCAHAGEKVLLTS